jgi:hypothetical protein
MASIVVNGDTSGAVTLSAPAVAGTVTVTLPAASGTMASLASVTANGVAYVNSSSQPTSGSALTFDGTNLGIGVTSPSDMLDVKGNARVGQGQVVATSTVGTVGIYSGISSGSGNAQLKFFGKSVDNTGLTYELGRISGGSFGTYGIDGGLSFSTALNNGSNVLTLSERMRLNASGNLGIGTTAPTSLLTMAGTTPQLTFNNSVVTGAQGVVFQSTGTDYGQITLNVQTGEMRIKSGGSSGYFTTFYTDSAERARIDSSGNLCVGNTNTAPGSGNTVTGCTLNGGLGIGYFSRSTDSSLIINTNANGKVSRIYRSGSEVGDITVTTTTTSFNSTSDYRLKTVLGAVSDSGSRIDALEPIEYTWNSTGLRTRGFLAHQFQEVYANSVAGTKDAIDDKGNPEYQSMQAGSSEVIADLVAEIQSLRKRLAALESA